MIIIHLCLKSSDLTRFPLTTALLGEPSTADSTGRSAYFHAKKLCRDVLNDEVRAALIVSDPVPLHVTSCLPCSTVSNTLLVLPSIEIDYAMEPTESAMLISDGVVFPPPGLCVPSREADSGEDFVFGIDYTISFGCSTNAAPVASDGKFILGLMTDESNSVFSPVVLDALPLLGSVVNTSPPPAISFDQSREGIG